MNTKFNLITFVFSVLYLLQSATAFGSKISLDISTFAEQIQCRTKVDVYNTLDINLGNNDWQDELKLLLVLREISTLSEKDDPNEYAIFMENNKEFLTDLTPDRSKFKKNQPYYILLEIKATNNCKHLVLFYRGTSKLNEWLNNMNHRHVPFDGYYGSFKREKPIHFVHKGFYETFKIHWGAIKLPVEEQLRKPQYNNEILLLGFSRGAAMAKHSLIALEKMKHKVVKTITFGSPRLGNDRFAQDFFNTGLNSDENRTNLISFVHGYDPVTHLPPANPQVFDFIGNIKNGFKKGFNFRHGGDLIWYKVDEDVVSFENFAGKPDQKWDQNYWSIPGFKTAKLGQVATNIGYHLPRNMFCELLRREQYN